MSEVLFNGINGFALKPPSQYEDNGKFRFINRREGDANNKEFIEITKERNKLPRVTLRTYVLYYRNNGNTMTTNYPGVGPTVAGNENYRFYNDYNPSGTTNDANGRQLGWIWGFPLFDVGRGTNSNNWPRWKSGASSTYGGTTNTYPNDAMLVDISDKQNIIVLDMAKFQFKDQNGTEKGDGYDDIKWIFTQNNNSSYKHFYMNLRITDSSENSISFEGTQGTVRVNGTGNDSQIYIGKNGNWPPCTKNDHMSWGWINRYDNKWCTLVEYEFYCDIINPKPFLDFTPDYFSFDFTGTINGRRFIENESKESYINNEFDGNLQINNYTEKITLKIKTGLGRDAAANSLTNNMIETMSPGNIIKGLTLRDNMDYLGYANRLKEKSAWNKGSNKDSWTLAKIIGGWYSRGESGSPTTRDIGYYGTIQSATSSMSSRDTSYNVTESWKNDIDLSNNPFVDNEWPALDNDTKTYTLRNVLWCSLRSPRKIKVSYIGNDSTQGAGPNLIGKHRFITNFIELANSGNGSNEILGGGYARNSNELDLPRKSEKPYFSKYKFGPINGQIINSNTVSINDYDIDNSIQYLDASSNNNSATLNLSDVNYYKIQYKLLIPPEVNKDYKITYSFGKTNECVTTFFRFGDMSGNPSPTGNNNQYAIRDNESIELKWEAGETDIKTIYIIDIASGTNNVNSTISTSDPSLNVVLPPIIFNAAPVIYDLSFNVFQLHFLSRNAANETNTNRDELPYTIYTFDTTSSEDKFVDISYSPINYVPYRYLNYFTKGTQEAELIFFPSNFSVGPFITREEKIEYRPGKIFPKGYLANPATNAVVIDPSNTDVFPDNIDQLIEIDISGDVIFDVSFAVTPNQLSAEDAQLPINQGQEIATFDQRLTPATIFQNAREIFQLTNVAKDGQGADIGIFFDEPLQLMLNNYLIPDYWRLSNKLNILRTTNDSGSSLDSYRYYNEWTNQIQTSMIFDILSIVLKSQGNINDKRISNILINSNIGSRGSKDYSAITATGNLLNNTFDDLVYDVQGAFGVPPTDYLNLEPIVVLLKASFDGPFGTLGQNFIGNKATAEGGIDVPYPAQPGIPQNDSKFVVNNILLDTLRRGNNVDGSDLGGNDSAYNGIFNIDSEVPNKEDYGLLKQNNSFIGTIIGPSPLPVLLVDISSAVQLNANQVDMLNDENNKVRIDWSGFSFSKDTTWELNKSNIYWTVTRYNISTGVSKSLLVDTEINYDLVNNKYTFVDSTVVVFTKYRYTVTGVFRWTGITDYVDTTEIPYLNFPGFSTPDILVCKFNRFPYGRYNSTSTNLKLYAPLRLTTAEGQEDQYGKKIGGPCRDPNNPSLNLFTRTSRISSSNNIYANTTNQVSKKQTYVILSKSRFRPFR